MKLHVKRDAVFLGDFEDLWHVGREGERAECFEIVFESAWGEEDEQTACFD